jgi:hypothetical protein
MLSMLRLAIAAIIFAIVGAIAPAATDRLVTPTEADPIKSQRCGSLSNTEDFQKFAEAYGRVKRATGRDPSVYAVSAEIGLNLHCHEM